MHKIGLLYMLGCIGAYLQPLRDEGLYDRSILDAEKYEDRITDESYALSGLMVSKNWFKNVDE